MVAPWKLDAIHRATAKGLHGEGLGRTWLVADDARLRVAALMRGLTTASPGVGTESHGSGAGSALWHAAAFGPSAAAFPPTVVLAAGDDGGMDA